LRLAQTFIGIKGRSSVLPSLRSSKTEGQANFVNPGLLLLNAGWDAELTPKLRTTVNFNAIALDKVETVQRLLFQGEIDKFLGVDVGIGFQWRPMLTDNLLVTAGVSAFLELGPGRVLASLVRQIAPGVDVFSADSPERLEAFAAERPGLVRI